MFDDNAGPGVYATDQTIPFNCAEHWAWDDEDDNPCRFDGMADVFVESHVAKGRCPECETDFEIDLG